MENITRGNIIHETNRRLTMKKNTISLAGAWRLVTFEFRKTDGSVIHRSGKRRMERSFTRVRPLFRTIDAEGSSEVQIWGSDEGERSKRSKPITKGGISYFGTFQC